MTQKILGLLVLGIAVQASAALAPYNERVRELNDILDSKEVEEVITDRTQTRGSKLVDSIALRKETTDTAEYDVRSGTCFMTVVLEYKEPEPGIAGPKQYDIKVPDKLTCPTIKKRSERRSR